MEILVEIGVYALFEVVGGLLEAVCILTRPSWLMVLAVLLAVGLLGAVLMS